MEPSYRRPPRPRRDYYSQEPVGAVRRVPVVGRPATVAEACEALIDHHQLDWQAPTLRNCRGYLLGGRFPEFCAHEGIGAIDELTTDHVERFLRDMDAILKKGTVTKYRTYLRALARFQAAVPGYGSGLQDIDRIPAPKQPGIKLPVALTVEEERAVLEACSTTRDRLLVETMLACGLRVSELCALLVDDLHITARPPFVHVRGSVHDRDRTKSGDDRKAPFRTKHASLPRRLVDFIAQERESTTRREVFLSRARGERGEVQPLTLWGVEQLMERLGRATGIHCNPHKLRHTWATRCADAGVPMFHLQQAGGWRSIEMVRRYYTATDRAMLEAFARTVEAGC
jgi:integrase